MVSELRSLGAGAPVLMVDPVACLSGLDIVNLLCVKAVRRNELRCRSTFRSALWAQSCSALLFRVTATRLQYRHARHSDGIAGREGGFERGIQLALEEFRQCVVAGWRGTVLFGLRCHQGSCLSKRYARKAGRRHGKSKTSTSAPCASVNWTAVLP